MPERLWNKEYRRTTIKPEDEYCYIAGDSMLYNIDGSHLSTCRSSVKVRCFPGSTLDDMLDFVKPIARMKPSHLILHVGTNDLPSSEVTDIPIKLDNLSKLIRSISPSTKVLYSNIITRTDTNDKFKQKVSEANKAINEYSKNVNITVINNDNIGVEHLARTGLHFNIFNKRKCKICH